MFFDGDWIICTPFDGRVVRDYHRLPAMHEANPVDNPAWWRFVTVVHGVCGQPGELKERAGGIQQAPDAVADEELATLGMAFSRVFRSSLTNPFDFSAQPSDLRFHHLAVMLEFGAVDVNPR